MKIRIIQEAKYGIMALGKDLEAWAKENGVTFKKLSSEKRLSSFGSTTSDTFYQIGNKFALVRYLTTPGAPRLNELKIWLLKAPNTKADTISSVSFINDFSRVRNMLSREIQSGESGGTAPTSSAKVWDKQKIDKLLRDLQADRQYRNMSDAEAFDVANAILDDNEGLEQAVQQIYKIQDVQGWLANKI